MTRVQTTFLCQQLAFFYAASEPKIAFQAKIEFESKTAAIATDIIVTAQSCKYSQKRDSVPITTMLADHAVLGAHLYT